MELKLFLIIKLIIIYILLIVPYGIEIQQNTN